MSSLLIYITLLTDSCMFPSLCLPLYSVIWKPNIISSFICLFQLLFLITDVLGLFYSFNFHILFSDAAPQEERKSCTQWNETHKSKSTICIISFCFSISPILWILHEKCWGTFRQPSGVRMDAEKKNLQ